MNGNFSLAKSFAKGATYAAPSALGIVGVLVAREGFGRTISTEEALAVIAVVAGVTKAGHNAWKNWWRPRKDRPAPLGVQRWRTPW